MRREDGRTDSRRRVLVGPPCPSTKRSQLSPVMGWTAGRRATDRDHGAKLRPPPQQHACRPATKAGEQPSRGERSRRRLSMLDNAESRIRMGPEVGQEVNDTAVIVRSYSISAICTHHNAHQNLPRIINRIQQSSLRIAIRRRRVLPTLAPAPAVAVLAR